MEALQLARADSPLVAALRPSPNFGPRVGRTAPDSLVLHYTGMADGESAIAWLCNPASNVSCHYVVEEDGRVLQLVAEKQRAWHAGRSSWAGETDMNSASIGIEIVNAGHSGGLPPFHDDQVAAVIALSRDIMARHAMPADRLLAHSDIAPGRKEDPGERFPWQRLSEEGVGLWLPPSPDAPGPVLGLGATGEVVAITQAELLRFGYGVAVTGVLDNATATVLQAFQRRYRPGRIDGCIDPSTRSTLEALAAARAALIPAPA